MVNARRVGVAIGPFGVELELVLGDTRSVVVLGCHCIRIGVGVRDLIRIVHRGKNGVPVIRGRLARLDLGGQEGLAQSILEIRQTAAAIGPERGTILRAVEPAPDEPVALADAVVDLAGVAVIMQERLRLDLARAQISADGKRDDGRVHRVFLEDRQVRRAIEGLPSR